MTTGSVTGLLQVRPGQLATGDFGEFGTRSPRAETGVSASVGTIWTFLDRNGLTLKK